MDELVTSMFVALTHEKPKVVFLLVGERLRLLDVLEEHVDATVATVGECDVSAVLIHDVTIFKGETFGYEVNCQG